MTAARAHTFDWPGAIARNRDALLRIVAVLFIYAGLDVGGADEVPRRVWRRIIRLLRPAEAAARRLIVIASRGIEVPPPKPRAQKAPAPVTRATGCVTVLENVDFGLARARPAEPAARPEKSAPAIPAFPLTDPPRRFDVRGWHGLRPFPQDGFMLADPNEEVSARALCRRIQALKRALDDIDGHAKRLARRRARRDAGLRGLRHHRFLRRGLPPGHRKRPANEADDILRECHALACQAAMPLNTS
jgi:hypothetical protein